MEHLLLPAEAAAILRTSTGALAQRRYKGQGPPYVQVSSNRVRYRESDLTSWIDSLTKTSGSDE